MSSEALAPAGSASTSVLPVSTESESSAKEQAQVRPPSSWVRLCQEFLKCHRRPINVLLHLITTPLGLFGFLALVQLLSPVATVAIVVAYSIALLFLVPTSIWLATTALVCALLAGVFYCELGWLAAGACLVVGYVGQEAAHWLASEKTLQSTYVGKRGMVGRFIEHTLLLLPVLLTIAARRRQSPLRLFVARKAVLYTHLTSPAQREDLNKIREWVGETQPNLTTSSHWWQDELRECTDGAFDRLSRDSELMSMIRRFHGPGYQVDPVLGMNELYVTGPPKSSTSDTVFYMGHVDGPWAVFPGARLYRCMVAASPNAQVTTHYPMSGTEYVEPEGYRLETGDAVAFDFNRELHYITREASAEQSEPRVNLKLHFVAYPASMSWYGNLLSKLTTDYDIRARNLFLQTIDPNSLWQQVKTKWVLGWTKIFELAVRYVGWTNLVYIALMAAISLVMRDLTWFLATTSFIHYAIYLGTFRENSPVSFGVFRRNAVLFKTLAMAQLFGVYAYNFSGEWLSLAIVLGGFSLATYATVVLGMNRTYFSAELGFDEHERIERFPYGVIPHPMVIGAMVGIAGMLLVPAMKSTYLWLIVGHLAGYTVVLTQEIVTTRRTLALQSA